MKLKNLLVITALFFLINGILALLAPATQLLLYGVTLGQGEKYMGQWAGLGSIVIGLLAWFARNVAYYEAQRAIILTLLIYYVIGVVISVLGTISGVMSAMGWSLVLIYLLFAIGYAYFLFWRPGYS